jgi:hypothetical protein
VEIIAEIVIHIAGLMLQMLGELLIWVLATPRWVLRWEPEACSSSPIC